MSDMPPAHLITKDGWICAVCGRLIRPSDDKATGWVSRAYWEHFYREHRPDLYEQRQNRSAGGVS